MPSPGKGPNPDPEPPADPKPTAPVDGERVSGVKGLLKSYNDGTKWSAEQFSKGISKLPINEAGTVAKSIGVFGRALPIVGSVFSGMAAWNAFKEHRYLQGVLYAIGTLPWPIGLIGMGGFVADLLGIGDKHYDPNGSPDAVSTWMLPAAASEVGGVRELDGQLRAAQNAVFGFQDGPTGTVWTKTPPPALRIDSPQVKSALSDWLTGVAGQADQLLSLMSRTDEPYILKARDQLRTQLEELKRLGELDQKIFAELASASKAANTWYTAILAENKTARMSLGNHGELGGGSGSSLESKGTAAQTAIESANTALAKLVDPAAAAATMAPPRVAPTRTDQVPSPAVNGQGSPTPQPFPQTPVTAQPEQKPETKPETKADGEKKDSPADKLLDQLGSALKPPLGGGLGNGLGSPLGGGMPLGGLGGLGGGTPLGGTPLGGGQRPLTPLGDRPMDPPKREQRPLAGGLTAGAPQNEKVADPVVPVSTPSAAEKQQQQPQSQVKPAAANTPAPEKPSTTVKVGGKDIAFPTEKTANLARELANSGPGKSVSIADVANRVGLVPPVPGQDPGNQIAPSDAKPGDMFVADKKQFLVLGDGRFLDPGDGRVLTADQLPKSLGQDGGYFRLVDPAATPQGGAGAVSPPPTTAPAFPVSDQQQAVPNGQTPAAAPTSPPPPAVPPVGGTPGVPAKGGTVPTNAAATDTGLPSKPPVTVGQRVMDPNGVK